jgi:hypothetical protein
MVGTAIDARVFAIESNLPTNARRRKTAAAQCEGG